MLQEGNAAGPAPPQVVRASGGNGELAVVWNGVPDNRYAAAAAINAYIVEGRRQKADLNLARLDRRGGGVRREGRQRPGAHLHWPDQWELAGPGPGAERQANDTDDATNVLGISSEVQAVTLAAANTNLPGAPTEVTVTPGTPVSGKLVVTWQPPHSDTGALVYGYTVRHKAQRR